uniref:Uncharacterized protein n=1 Tax=Vitis vinifera TaxID=29760 RepID=A5C1Y1_VITVI|nr:hypothetical protein VITISV_024037 [Vitis vinifera]
MIRTTYPDRICYHPECDVHECRIAWRRMSSWGIQMELSRMGPYTLYMQTVPLAQHSSVHPGRNSVRRHFISRISCADILHPNVSCAPTFLHPDISHPDGRGRRFNFSGQTYPDPLIAFTRRVSQPFCTVPRQTNSEDFSSEDERLGPLSLGVKKVEYFNSRPLTMDEKYND